MSTYYKEQYAIKMARRPSDVLAAVYGSVTKGAKALRVTAQDAYNWNRFNRIPKAVYDRMLSKDRMTVRSYTASVRPVRVPQPYRLSATYGTTPAPARRRVTTPQATPSDNSVATLVSRLERENSTLRAALAAIRLSVSRFF